MGEVETEQAANHQEEHARQAQAAGHRSGGRPLRGPVGDMDAFRENMETIAKLRGVLNGNKAVEINVQNQQTAVVQQWTAAELIAEYAVQIQAAYEPPPDENGPKP